MDSASSRVVRAKLRSGVEALVKIVFYTDPGTQSRAHREIKLLETFRDVKAQHICTIKEYVLSNPAYSAAMLELMELGTLRTFIHEAPPAYTLQSPKVAGGATRTRFE